MMAASYAWKATIRSPGRDLKNNHAEKTLLVGSRRSATYFCEGAPLWPLKVRRCGH